MNIETWLITAISIAIGIAFFSRITALAFWESQIERENPWAGALNVWRVWVKKIPKEITAYHLGLAADTVSSIISNDIITISFLLLCGLITDILSISQIVMFLGAYLLVKTSMIILQFIFEDYLWHILNPRQDKFGFHTFTKKKYPAVCVRMGIIPGEYILAILVAGLFNAIAGLLISIIRESFSILWMAIVSWLIIVCVLLILTVAITIKSPEIHRTSARIASWIEKELT